MPPVEPVLLRAMVGSKLSGSIELAPDRDSAVRAYWSAVRHASPSSLVQFR
jgi:hypothetical protein